MTDSTKASDGCTVGTVMTWSADVNGCPPSLVMTTGAALWAR